MKRILFAITSVATLFIACNKSSDEKLQPKLPDGEKLPVVFSVADFIKKVESMPQPGARKAGSAAKDTALGTKVGHIVYILYPEMSNDPIKTIRQSVNANPLTFGTIRDSVPEGNYRVAIIAMQDSLNINSECGFTIPYAGEDEIRNIGDAFGKMFGVTISSGSTNVIEDITLTRFMGKMEVNVLDGASIENNNQEVIVMVRPLQQSYSVLFGYSTAPIISVSSKLSRASATKFEGYILPATELSIKISIRDKTTGNIVSEKFINNISVGTNQRTILSGNLTGANSNSNGNWDLLLNQNWGQDVIVEY